MQIRVIILGLRVKSILIKGVIMLIIKNFQIEKTILQQERFHKYEAIDKRSQLSCVVYAFQATNDQNHEIIWNDFHIAIHSLRKALGENLIEADILADTYYFSIKLPESMEDVVTMRKATLSEMQRFHIWMKVMQQIATIHAQGITHGHLNKKNTFFLLKSLDNYIIKTVSYGDSIKFSFLNCQ